MTSRLDRASRANVALLAMPILVAPYQPRDRDAWRDLLRDPALARDFAPQLASGEMEDPLAHPILHPGGVWLAREGGAVVGFGMLLALPSAHGPWAMVRLGVRAAHRRRGIGAALLAEVERALAAIPPERAPFLLAAAAGLPAEEARTFLEGHGFRHFRFWWYLERPLGPVGDFAWPPDAEARPFDGTELAFREWTGCYNDAFAERFPSHLATVDEARQIANGPLFRADGLLLIWRGERCLGFCRDTIFPDHGEVDVLAVRPEAQGTGLGRALLRWGVGWLQSREVARVRLLVDGENEKALRLYRSEGFDVASTRAMWTRPGPGPARPAATPPGE
ncbi:MAG: GNAT family N-acetyltransferase [bacterium]